MAAPPPTSPRAAGMKTATHNDWLVGERAGAARGAAPAPKARRQDTAADAKKQRCARSVVRAPTQRRFDSARDQHVFEVLACASSGATVHMATQTLFETEAGPFEDLRIELAPIVDDDHDRGASPQDGPGVQQHLDDPVRVSSQGSTRVAGGGCADLELASIVQPEQFVRVAMLLVVVDQARVRRGGEHAVVAAGQPLLAHVPVDHRGAAATGPDTRELLQARQRVERVTPQELRGRLDGTAFAAMLVTPVGLALRLARKLEVEVGRATCRSRRAGKDYAEHVCMFVFVDQRTEAEQLSSRLRREPLADIRGRTFAERLAHARVDRAELLLQHERVVRTGLDVHEQAVEGRDVDAGRIEPALERLHESRPRARERVEHVLAWTEISGEHDLHELRDELAEVRMEPVDVLRPLALREITLGPGERQIDLGIEGFLCRGHSRQFDAEIRKPRRPAPDGRSERP